VRRRRRRRILLSIRYEKNRIYEKEESNKSAEEDWTSRENSYPYDMKIIEYTRKRKRIRKLIFGVVVMRR
jgi:hypothetical protein